MRIATLSDIRRRELDRRMNGGFEVTLYWDAADNSTSIDVHHMATDETISLRVPADRALDAFHHPFVYLEEVDTEYRADDDPRELFAA
jgi:hypothetical protein